MMSTIPELASHSKLAQYHNVKTLSLDKFIPPQTHAQRFFSDTRMRTHNSAEEQINPSRIWDHYHSASSNPRMELQHF
ncbi:hypothetical protein TNCV_1955881 [Trichonephila clavipes]|nr:hypothetical protein TNCV_1955881 [Trichonephila clavipes]